MHAFGRGATSQAFTATISLVEMLRTPTRPGGAAERGDVEKLLADLLVAHDARSPNFPNILHKIIALGRVHLQRS